MNISEKLNKGKLLFDIPPLILVLAEGLVVISLFLNIGVFLIYIFPETSELTNRFYNIITSGFQLGTILKMLDLPGILTLLFFYYMLYFARGENVYFGGLKETVEIPTRKLRYIAIHSSPSILKGFLITFWFISVSGYAYLHLYHITLENTGILYMKVVFDTYMLSLFMVMFISNYAFLLENPLHAILDLALIVFWTITGYIIVGSLFTP